MINWLVNSINRLITVFIKSLGLEPPTLHRSPLLSSPLHPQKPLFAAAIALANPLCRRHFSPLVLPTIH
ncbi:hypothetical protein GUJ93_ZPchr0010g8715 [Zizania palustris]|uniref:Uncharacterized protein n=1 Tax=Zizania palustris TaxID=103762 RepID=A0A8J5W8W5_ZIZPA|nr:hypothetical protein GUJ93_ZPchr0010g8715 [Zizania palustris]